ncbi:MAG: methionyl-tRNA formyltransferase [Chloroflexota bacterium]
MNILLAAFYSPGIRAIEYLIQRGFEPRQIRLISHDLPRNQTLMVFAGSHNIEWTTLAIRSTDALEWVRDFRPDVLFSLYFRDIVPEAVLGIPRLGAVNLHPSLLPKYRGAFSAPHVILNGERRTGFTYHYMLPQVDTGNIILQVEVSVSPNDTAYSLYHRLIIEGMAAFDEAFRLVTETQFPGGKQTGEPSYYPRRLPNNGYIDASWSREQIDRFIRAMYFPPNKGAVVRVAGGAEREVSCLAEYDTLVAEGQIVT